MCEGPTITAYLDGKQLALVKNENYANGMPGLATGWNHAWFKDFSIKPLPHLIWRNLALGKPATASSEWSNLYAPKFAVDGNVKTRWNTAWGKAAGQWLAIDLGKVMRVSRVVIQQLGGRIEEFNGCSTRIRCFAGPYGAVKSMVFAS